MQVCIGDFVEAAKPISANLPLSRVVDLFLNDPQAQFYILVRDKRPAGLISRTLAFEFAASSSAANQSHLAIGDLITARALVLKSETTIAAFVAKAGKQLDAFIRRGCLVVEDKRFKGVLSPVKLQEALVESLRAPGPTETVDELDLPATDEESTQSAPLLGSLAHEIRTPLTAIMGLSDILAGRLKDAGSRDIAQTIVRSSHTLDRILTDALDYSRLEAGKLQIQPEDVDLSEFTDEIRSLWSNEASRRGLSLRVGFVPDGPHRLYTDIGRIRQIANNLISNALKFTREGEISVSLSTQTLGSTLMLSLSVSDTGKGLSLGQRDRFMKVFEKGPDADGVKGWGLGLTISRALATALGGELSYADNPGGGSMFTLCVPAARAHPVSQNIETATMPKKGKFELGDVLLVEDHHPSAMVVIEALEHAGWTVHHASSLQAAETYSAQTRFQAIVTDLHLPDGNAMSLIDSLRRRGGVNTSTPIIALTADTAQTQRQACLEMGADRAMSKPVAGPQLVATIADVLMARAAGHASGSELRRRMAS